MLSALWNGALWLTPFPLHLISLVLPFVSAYAIASDRTVKGVLPSLEIGLVMGLSLLMIAAIPSIPIVLTLSIFFSVDVGLAVTIALIVAGAAAGYTFALAFTGALYAAYRSVNAKQAG